MFVKVYVVMAELMKFSASELERSAVEGFCVWHLQQLHFMNRGACWDICLQNKRLLSLSSSSQNALVPACSHLQACCQSGKGREEYDLFDMAVNSQIANEKGGLL